MIPIISISSNFSLIWWHCAVSKFRLYFGANFLAGSTIDPYSVVWKIFFLTFKNLFFSKLSHRLTIMFCCCNQPNPPYEQQLEEKQEEQVLEKQESIVAVRLHVLAESKEDTSQLKETSMPTQSPEKNTCTIRTDATMISPFTSKTLDIASGGAAAAVPDTPTRYIHSAMVENIPVHTPLGVSNLNISETLHFMPPDPDESDHPIEGTPYQLHCQWLPCMPDERVIYSPTGDQLINELGLYDYDTLDHPEQLVGKPWCYQFTIDRLTRRSNDDRRSGGDDNNDSNGISDTNGHANAGANDSPDGVLPYVCMSAYCTYTFRGVEYRTTVVCDTNSPVFDYSYVHVVPSVDKAFVRELQTKSIRVWVFIRQSKASADKSVIDIQSTPTVVETAPNLQHLEESA